MISEQRKKIHPHKFALWIAIGSIIMMFAAFTSAYIVKKGQSNWLSFELPTIFWYSTCAILISSITMHFALKSFRNRAMQQYKMLITITVLLGLAFVTLQWLGFMALQQKGILLLGNNSNASASFLGVISGMHIVHILGGVIALVIILFKSYGNRTKNYNVVPIEIVSTYWHFVDLLWIYLFIFFKMIG